MLSILDLRKEGNKITCKFKGKRQRFCRIPVLGLGLGVDFTFSWDNKSKNKNKKNPNLNFLKGMVLRDKEQEVGIRGKG